MGKKALLLIVLAFCTSCLTRKAVFTPEQPDHFRSLHIKFSFRDGDTAQNGRFVWRFDGERSKFIFFTPLNQVHLELNVAGEDAVLVNFARKEHWQGPFHILLERLWGVDMSLTELTSLVLSGEAPLTRFSEQGIVCEVERHEPGAAPRSLRLKRGGADLTLRTTRSESRAGKVVLAGYERHYRVADLESVLEWSE